MKEGVKVYTQDGSVVAEFISVRREGDKLIVDGKALGAMRMDMIFRLEEILNSIKMALCWSLISYILFLPYFVVRHYFFRSSKN